QKAPQLSQTVEGLWLIASGAVKKLLIADHLAVFVNLSFENLERAGSTDIWLATFAFGLQLYLDFSGYVDIARGSAIFLGFNLPQNFNFPYFATSIADFWRRWHMTLGAWLRNYLYFPLGGSRRGILRTCLNLVIVMLIAGIWHGDNWGFLIWGGLHGLALAIHRLMQAAANRWPWLEKGWTSPPGALAAWLITQGMVFGSWLFFKLFNPKDFTLALEKIWGHAADIQFIEKVYIESLGLSRPQLMLLLGSLMIVMGIIYGFNRDFKLQLSWPVKLLLVPVCLFLAWLLAPSETLPYIYFEF
ncbi:MAG: MBOAT family protein, partial [Pseudanabaenales cyanobacterium]|nr:MBOAT family protein [Pseudanabaenales cyanobacterium]